jgi:uncharacterized RDD family membrane protein YckC
MIKMKKKETDSLALTSPSHRIIAAMFDLAIIILFSLVFLIPSIAVYVNALLEPNAWTLTATYIVAVLSGGVIALLILLYEVVLPLYWKGQTLGMRFFKMKYVREEGGELSIAPLLISSVTALSLALLTFGLYFLVELFAIAGSDHHRSFADTVSRVYVVDTLD